MADAEQDFQSLVTKAAAVLGLYKDTTNSKRQAGNGERRVQESEGSPARSLASTPNV